MGVLWFNCHNCGHFWVDDAIATKKCPRCGSFGIDAVPPGWGPAPPPM